MRLLASRYRITSAERTFLQDTPGAARGRSEGSPVIMVEAVEDHFYLALFSHVVAGIAAERSVQVHQFLPRSLRPGSTRSVLQAIKSALFYNALTDRKWRRLYSAFCCRVAYRSASPLFSAVCLRDLVAALRVWRGLESKESLIGLTLCGISVGDLINDTYLRFKPAATVDLRSPYLWIVIWQTLRDLRAAGRYIADARPAMFLATYSTYIQHGIAARVALAAGVKVYTFGNFQEFYKRLHMTDWVQTKNPDAYRAEFAKLRDPERCIGEAGEALGARISGVNDTATAYMQSSAYKGSAVLPDGMQGSLLVFLHDFFDSPHCYRWMIFPDFWEWATFTLDVARSAGIKVFVKPHPNQIANSKSIVRRLTAEYPEATWLSTETSNLQIAKAGAACAVTVYGTVAHEMAYLGIPSIAAGHNPHISFSFCKTARSRDEYRRLILNYRGLDYTAQALKRESLEFYYMHNLAVTAEQAKLRDVVVKFWMLVNKTVWLEEGAEFIEFRRRLEGEPAFREACSALGAELESARAAHASARLFTATRTDSAASRS